MLNTYYVSPSMVGRHIVFGLFGCPSLSLSAPLKLVCKLYIICSCAYPLFFVGVIPLGDLFPNMLKMFLPKKQTFITIILRGHNLFYFKKYS